MLLIYQSEIPTYDPPSEYERKMSVQFDQIFLRLKGANEIFVPAHSESNVNQMIRVFGKSIQFMVLAAGETLLFLKDGAVYFSSHGECRGAYSFWTVDWVKY